MSHDDLLIEIEQTRPLSVLMAENIAELREWAANKQLMQVGQCGSNE
jgi:hypothetical protein